MNIKIVLPFIWLIVGLEACQNSSDADSSTATGTQVITPIQPQESLGSQPSTVPEKIVYYVLERHENQDFSMQKIDEIIAAIPDSPKTTVHLYLEGKWPKRTEHRGNKTIVYYGEESSRVTSMTNFKAGLAEQEMREKTTRILDWVQLSKGFSIPEWSPEMGLWYTLYNNSDAITIKNVFETEYLPLHKGLVDSVRQEFLKWQFTLDNEFYQRLNADTAKVVIVNFGSAHRRAVWKLNEEHEKKWRSTILMLGSDQQTENSIKGWQFANFLVFSEAEYKNFAWSK